jgi:hypothetical protein
MDQKSARRSRLSGRGRACIAWGLLAFVAIQLSLASAIELWRPELRDPIYGNKLQQLRSRIAAASGESPLVVMLGSSRAVHGFDAATVEQRLRSRLEAAPTVYNFGIPGAGPVTELVCLQRLLAEGIRPDLVLVEVLPPMLAGQTLSFDQTQFPANRLWLREIPLVERYTQDAFPEQQLHFDWWRGWWAPAFTHRFPIMCKLCPSFVPHEGNGHLFATFDEQGWNAMPDQVRTPQRIEKGLKTARREYEELLAQFQLGGGSCRALEELLTVCKQEQIAAALVVMPEGDAFQSLYPAQTWRQIENYLQELSAQFSAPLINGREWAPEEQFLDSHHLLTSGARTFSERLTAHAAPLVETLQVARRGSISPR